LFVLIGHAAVCVLGTISACAAIRVCSAVFSVIALSAAVAAPGSEGPRVAEVLIAISRG
jgi:hypothetical protein